MMGVREVEVSMLGHGGASLVPTMVGEGEVGVAFWSPSWVYPVEVLHHLLGAKAEQHVLAAASSSKQQAPQKSLRPHRGSKPASK